MMSKVDDEMILQSLSKFLLPSTLERDESFWKSHFCILENLPIFEALVRERVTFFEKDNSRNNAISLILAIDMCWQLVRTLADRSGKDEKWLCSYLGQFGQNNKSDFYRDKEIVENFVWVFELHSLLRHPGAELMEAHSWLFHDPWPASEASRIMDASKTLKRMLRMISTRFRPVEGFEGDVEEKQRLLALAKTSSGY